MADAPVRKRGSAAKQERGASFWTAEHLTSAPFLLIVATVLLCATGLIMVFSASSIESVSEGSVAWNELVHQAVFMAVAVVACVVVRLKGGDFWVVRFFWVLWICTFVLLMLVLVLGDESHGATRWLYVGPVSMQPSEFAKITTIMAAARLLVAWEKGSYSRSRMAVSTVLLIFAPMGLILAQKDLGTLLILAATMFLMLVLAGVDWRILVGLVIAGVLAVVVLVLTAGYRMARFTIWLDPYSDYFNDGWQLIHGLYAFGSGGFFGVGLGNSSQKYSYLPEAENDFIFAIIGEELGFLGCLFVVALFVLLGVSGARIARAARERSKVASLMAWGLTILILVQALLNMGGVLQVIPLSGRPLPFISAGGSSILANMIIVGLLLGVARDNERGIAPPESPCRGRFDGFTVVHGGSSDRSSGRRSASRERSVGERMAGRRVRSSGRAFASFDGDDDDSYEKGRR